ncbi:MAG: hypothetical protein JXR12_05890 [Neptunomonas phycophila]|uniref:hypothetical protein n=1 Tax=Neptunomonas phycophila TaxID=1572645 RepID=UPI003B8D4167
MSNRVYSKPADSFKMLPVTDEMTATERLVVERLNFSRKVVNLRGGINKALRAYNRRTNSEIALATFKRYHAPGSSGDSVIRFILNNY